MITADIISGLRSKFPVHPLIFQRSLERAKSGGDLFDILSTIPQEYPIVWSEDERKWLTTTDIFQIKGSPYG